MAVQQSSLQPADHGTCPKVLTCPTVVTRQCQDVRNLARAVELSGLGLILNEQRHGLELLHVDQSLVGQFE